MFVYLFVCLFVCLFAGLGLGLGFPEFFVVVAVDFVFFLLQEIVLRNNVKAS